jgi:hypothetical protein
MYSKGISWIDDCRIPFVDEKDIKSQERAFSPNSSSHKGQAWNNHLGWEGSKGTANDTNTQGRFPANLLVSDDMLNDGVISKGKVGMTQQSSLNKIYGEFQSKGNTTINDGIADKGTNSRYYNIDKWFDKILND